MHFKQFDVIGMLIKMPMHSSCKFENVLYVTTAFHAKEQYPISHTCESLLSRHPLFR